jgi:hypothetical protein
MDTFHIASHHSLIPKGKYPSKDLAGLLSHQLLVHAKDLQSPGVPRNLQSSLYFRSRFGSTDYTPPRALVMPTPSPIESNRIEAPEALYSLIDQNGKEHHCVPFKK